MAISSTFMTPSRKRWWLTNPKIVERYLREAKELIASHEQREIGLALNILDAAISISPGNDRVLELKARCLIHLRRFKEVVTMLQDYLPSLRMSSSLHGSSTTSSSELSSPSQLSKREGVKLLSSGDEEVDFEQPVLKCFSVSDFKNKVLAKFGRNYENQGQWRYMILGEACCHLGMMEDAMLLLQTGKRLATAAFRRESICLSDDSFSSFSRFQGGSIITSNQESSSCNITELLIHIKHLLRRKALAVAALDAGLHSEAIRHFSKIVDGRRGGPQGFLAECYLQRASAYQSVGRLVEAIADCNRTLALEPSCLGALHARAALFEIVCCFPDSLHDLEHLRLLYNSVLRDRKLPGPAWKRQDVQYREIPGKLCSLVTKIQGLKQRVALGKIVNNVDNYALMGLHRGCTRSELERAYRLLMLRHKPENSTAFMEKCGFADEHEADLVRERAKMSSFLLYRLIQRGYTSLMETMKTEESAKMLLDAPVMVESVAKAPLIIWEGRNSSRIGEKTSITTTMPSVFPTERVFDSKAGNRSEVKNMTTAPVFQGVFYRDLTVVGNLISQTGFNNHLPVKYEALSC